MNKLEQVSSLGHQMSPVRTGTGAMIVVGRGGARPRTLGFNTLNMGTPPPSLERQTDTQN